ncbi:Crp/Fnr family transcriptional regulator [Nitratidesulfovibrio sp. HK-II]|uniref:Crp/Fnr family transcriptional regulator n=1 Tax=Nitratidesulfovibrio sp. HK-II TaxID=2009266 RepID=UPI000E2F9744|nr:Crp/Fnr family transcriptional regulator [Nitratidesulfovibrio sp. HK-II]GBO97981.1 cAMP-binding proteins [Nitratidesulfovibrio sp. HK-II]
MERNWHLWTEDFFADLPDERAAFLALSRRRDFAKNDMVFFEEDSGDSCFYVEQGIVRIFRIAPSGKEPIFFLRRRGEMFGLAEVLDSVPRKANAQALTPCVLREAGRDEFEKFLSGHFGAARRVIATLGGRVRYLGEQVGNLMTCDVGTRLAKLLVYMAYEVLGDEAAWLEPAVIPVRLTQEQMAAMTGSCQQTVSDFLREMQDEGLVRVTRREVVVLHPLRLLERAEL